MATKKVTDDEILDWWADYADGLSTTSIAYKYGRSLQVIRTNFVELGILHERPEWYWSDRSAMERAAAAIARIDPDTVHARNEVAFARSMQHAIPATRGPVVQSARQREQDKMATSFWRQAVRYDLRVSGLLPRGGRGY